MVKFLPLTGKLNFGLFVDFWGQAKKSVAWGETPQPFPFAKIREFGEVYYFCPIF
jgi:hypothetical protein